jgi:hypothetical protein
LSLGELGLKESLVSRLRAAGITDEAALCGRYAYEVKKIKGIGAKALQDIQAALGSRGLRLRLPEEAPHRILLERFKKELSSEVERIHWGEKHAVANELRMLAKRVIAMEAIAKWPELGPLP